MHRFTRWLALGLLGGLLSVSLPSLANPPEPEYLTVRNGLPQGFVNSMLQDQHGFIWLSTRDGLCRYDGIRFRIYSHDPQQKKSLSFSSLYEIREDNRGNIWVRTENNNVDCFDPVTEQSKRLSNTNQFRQALGRDQLAGIYPDRLGNVWVITQTNGFFRLNANGSISHRHWEMRGDTVQRAFHTMLLDQHNRLWLAAHDGLFSYDIASGKFSGYRTAQGLPQNDVHSLHERANGELMLGFPGRFALFNPADGRVRKVVTVPGNPTELPLFTRDSRQIDYVNQNRYTDKEGLVSVLPIGNSSLTGSKLGQFSAISLLVDRTNVLWLGLNGNGVIKYDLNKKLFQTWPYVNTFQTDWLTQQFNVPLDAIPASLRQQTDYEMHHQFDGTNALWISSARAVPYRYDASQRTFIAVQPTGIEAHWLPPGEPFRLTTIAIGAQGDIWGLLAPHNQAVVRYNASLKNFTAFPLPLPKNNSFVIRAMLVDGGRIYLATKNQGLLQADLSTKRLIRWQSGGTEPGMLPDDALLSLAQDPIHYNHLWIGTFGRGLCRLDKLTGKIQQFTMSQGLPNNVIYAIRPDKNGHLWLSTNRGLCRFDTRTSEVRNYTADDGLPSDEFNLFHDVALPDGRLIFGGINGYTIFDPQRIREDPYKPVVALTALRINNQLVSALTPDSPIQRDINETSNIELTHEQNFLSIDFAALQFNQSRKNQYRYKLIGLDNDWIYSGNQATATYTNLPPKTYTFVVNASNTSGIWSPYVHQLQLTIAPPLWATWWAYSAYALLLLGMLIGYIRVRFRRMHQKSQMELREQEAIQLKHLDEVKSRFFANITHEFRTPLTLIISPLEQLLKETTESPYHKRLGLVYRNANRLLRLINELLDLAKLEAGSLTVTPTPANLPEFIHRTVLVFTEEAERRQIQLQLINQISQHTYWFDSDKVEKILTNLLSNALKFTDPNGSITVALQAEPIAPNPENPVPTDLIRMSVHNTGAGIPVQNLPYVFDRFYQATPLSETSVNGSGIGLSLVKELVEMMQGTISVESNSSLGTIFTVTLPCHQARATSTADTAINLFPSTTDPSQTIAKNSSVDESVPRILLVEDDNDIAEYVTSVLSTEWHVQRVNNGRSGVEAAIANGPDLIISDVLMPEMNGFELCRQLKTNSITNHIPILLLTAKVAIESRLEGLTAGADDYLAKPFQVDELRARIRNRLEHQQRIRQYYRTQFLREGHLPQTSQAPEDEFMNKIYTILEARLDDQTFGVEPLADAVGMSRMHLSRKTKAMTGLTPNELIRMIRLKRAAELLLTGASISEVADRVGFDTPAYFSKVFKDQYRLTPSEYIEKNRHEMV
ncbi:response regulator [Spirosoma validum]|uniref:histidine kinase n=1 Tax=Spirosoma validum TaxID=2771355 RepID=A0A927B309_9BACT|nr:response regulator [Spirosoma validum]MBD2754302.1 response regulator [Spirosoma validum]